MRKLVLLDDAKNDIKQIRKYTLLSWGKQQSVKYLTELIQKLNLINRNPNLGIQKPDANKRVMSFPHKSHVVYYHFTEYKTFIIRVLHKNMLPKKHL